MKKYIKTKILLLFVCLIPLFFIFEFSIYEYTQAKNKKNILKECLYPDTRECSKSAFELLLPKMLIYNAEKDKKPLNFAKFGSSPVWHPFYNFKISNEYIHYSEFQNEPLVEQNNDYYKFLINDFYGINIQNFKFSESKLKEQTQKSFFSSMQRIKETNKKAILQLDLKKYDEKFINKIFYEYTDTITGINLFWKFDNYNEMLNCLKLLDKINENYILVSRTSQLESYNKLAIETKYYKGDIYDSTFVLSYVNKNQLDKYNISMQQNTDRIFNGEKIKFFRPFVAIPKSDIHWTVTITEIFKEKFINCKRHKSD